MVEHNCIPTDPILRLAGYYWMCDYCGAKFATYSACEAHLPAVPPTIYECTRCAPCPYGDFPNCVTRTSEISQADACQKAQQRAEELLAIHMATHPPKADITLHIAPAEASAGQDIEVGGIVKNIGEAGKIKFRAEGNGQLLFEETPMLQKNESFTKKVTVKMPDRDFKTDLKAYHLEGTQWIWDLTSTFTTKLITAEVPPVTGALYALRCHYYNIAGLGKENIQGAVEKIAVPVVNPIVCPLGYDYVKVDASAGYASQWKAGYFDIIYKAKGSPAIPVALIAKVIIVLIAGIVIFWLGWVYLETSRMEYESKKSLDDLLREGYIDQETYEKLREAEEKPSMWDQIMGMLPYLLLFLIIASIAGALPRGRRED